MTGNSFEGTVDVGQEGFLHIAQTYDPHIAVMVDGTKVKTVRESQMGFIVIPVSQGIHVVKLWPTLTSLEKILSLMSAVVFVLCLGVLLFGAWGKIVPMERSVWTP